MLYLIYITLTTVWPQRQVQCRNEPSFFSFLASLVLELSPAALSVKLHEFTPSVVIVIVYRLGQQSHLGHFYFYFFLHKNLWLLILIHSLFNVIIK